MGASLMHKLKNWVAGDPYEDDVFEYASEFDMEPHHFPAYAQEEYAMPEAPKANKKNLKVVDHPAAAASNAMQQVVVLEPRSFEEALDMIEHLRARKSVLLNLHMLDMAQSQRVVDFLSGATHAIEGNQQRVGDGVFMFTPNNVMIEQQQRPANTASATTQNDTFWKASR